MDYFTSPVNRKVHYETRLQMLLNLPASVVYRLVGFVRNALRRE